LEICWLILETGQVLRRPAAAPRPPPGHVGRRLPLYSATVRVFDANWMLIGLLVSGWPE
jgi:hypothetical protein